MSQFKSREFNKLREEWYKKLEREGFKDIEEYYPVSDKTFLKVWDSHYFKSESHGFYGDELHKLKADYFYYAVQYFHQGTFDNDTEKEIWNIHAQGLGVRKIAEKLNETRINGSAYTRDKVWRTVKRLRLNMRAFLRMERDGLSKENVLSFRPRKGEDTNFIINTWWNNLYSNVRWIAGFMDREKFGKYHDILVHIMNKSEVVVCCLKEDPDVIIGYSVFEKTDQDTILHWVFVRNDWQRKGIARDLVPSGITIATHLTKTGERILEKRQVSTMIVNLPRSFEILETGQKKHENMETTV